MNTRPYTFDRVVRMLIGLTVLVLLFLLMKRLSSVLLPFLIAWLLAYLLQPIVHFFQHKLKFKSRVLSIAATLIGFLGIITAVVWVLTPIITSEIQKVSRLILDYSQNLNVNSFLPLSWQNEIRNYLSHLDIQSILQDENIMAGIKRLAPQLWDLIYGSVDFVLGLAVVLVVFLYLVFILLDFENISTGMVGIIPVKYRTLVVEIIEDMETGMNRYFRGQSLIGLIVGVLCAIGFTIIQLPLAIVAGLLIGLLTIVPYLKVVGLIPCAILGLLQSVETGRSYVSILLGIIIVFVVVQMIEDLFLTPKIMGKVTGLNPAVIMLSLSIWGSLMGMVGLIIALPVTTLIISYYKRFVLNDTIEEETEPLVDEPEQPTNVEM
ncbi:MAG TPA: AI-2E family transporter [Paludibacter sp.]